MFMWSYVAPLIPGVCWLSARPGLPLSLSRCPCRGVPVPPLLLSCRASPAVRLCPCLSPATAPAQRPTVSQPRPMPPRPLRLSERPHATPRPCPGLAHCPGSAPPVACLSMGEGLVFMHYLCIAIQSFLLDCRGVAGIRTVY